MYCSPASLCSSISFEKKCPVAPVSATMVGDVVVVKVAWLHATVFGFCSCVSLV